MDIIQAFDDYLRHLNKENQSVRKKDSEDRYSASGAGMCLRKHHFANKGYPRGEIKPISLRAMRLGTIFGADFEDAMKWFFKQEFESVTLFTEEYIQHPTLPIGGHFDILIVDNKGDGYLYDVKTSHDFKYKKLFGRNRDTNPSTNYQQQLGSYAWILDEMYKHKGGPMYTSDSNGKMKPLCKKIVYMANAYFNKNTSNMQMMETPLDFIEIAEEYWERLLSYEQHDEIPALGDISPAYVWECKGYCDFIEHCDSPHIVHKETKTPNIITKQIIKNIIKKEAKIA